MKKKIWMSLFLVLMMLLVLFLGIFLFTEEESEKTTAKKTKEPVTQVPAEEQELPPVATLTEQEIQTVIDKELLPVKGTVHYGVRVYGDQPAELYTDSGPVPAASVIKLFVMEYAYSCITAGTVTPETQIEGIALSRLIADMITVSDNEATNKLIRYFTMDAMNAYFKEQGYSDTALNRYMLDTEAMNNGKDNVSSVKDVMLFLDRLYQKRNQTPCSDMLEIMKRQTRANKIRKNMPDGVAIANKTGELPGKVENDVGIIFGGTVDFQVVYLISDVQDNEDVQNKIANTTLKLYELIETKVK